MPIFMSDNYSPGYGLEGGYMVEICREELEEIHHRLDGLEQAVKIISKIFSTLEEKLSQGSKSLSEILKFFTE